MIFSSSRAMQSKQPVSISYATECRSQTRFMLDNYSNRSQMCTFTYRP